jgi:chitodextrinase
MKTLFSRLVMALLLTIIMVPVSAQTFSSVMDSTEWNTFFPHRFNPDDRTGAGTLPGTAAKDFYSYANFVKAVNWMSNIKILVERRCATNLYRLTRTDKTTGASVVIRKSDGFDASASNIIATTVDYASFAGEGDLVARKRELMAFFANISQETTGGWPTAPGGPYAWGLYFREEVGYEGTTNIGYVDGTNTEYPPAAGKSYHGRGPVQLSYNYNYGQASEFIFGDKNVLLANPEKVIQDGAIAFETAIWFWMAEQYPKPSCHDVMIPGKWTPVAGIGAGFGATVNIINGGVECGSGTENTKVLGRIGHYQRYTGLKGVSLELNGGNNASNCGCATMPKFTIDAAECSKVVSLTFTAPANGILNVSSLSPVTLSVSKNDPNNEVTAVYITVDGQRLTGTSVSWTPTAYRSYTARAAGVRPGKDSVIATTTFSVWNSATFEGCAYLPAWDAGRTYAAAGNIVLYNAVVYRNQWWAGPADVPGSNDTWAVVGNCSGNGGNGGGNGQSCGSIPGWKQGDVYTAGKQVAYNGKIYQAKWWTQGNQPDQNAGDGLPWTYIGLCTSAKVAAATAYPNPVSGNTLQVNTGTTAQVVVYLVDVQTGTPVVQQVTSDSSVQLDISQVPAGIWILKIEGKGKVLNTSKIIRIR